MALTWDEQNEADKALLRETAEHMRTHHPEGHPRHEFWKTLAEWLDDIANFWTKTYHLNAKDRKMAKALCLDYHATKES